MTTILKSGDLHRLYDEWKSAQPKERHIPNGMGRYTREEFAARIKSGKNWHEALRLSDLKKAKEKLG